MKLNIVQLDRQTATGGVITAHWTATETQGEYSAYTYGSVGFTPDPQAADFVPFEQLTEAQVVAWVEEVLGAEQLANIQTNLSAQIAEQQAPKVTAGLPWAPMPSEAPQAA